MFLESPKLHILHVFSMKQLLKGHQLISRDSKTCWGLQEQGWEPLL